jgi:hypothetical protein
VGTPLRRFAVVGNIASIAAPIFATAWFSTSGVRYGKIAESKENKSNQPLILASACFLINGALYHKYFKKYRYIY